MSRIFTLFLALFFSGLSMAQTSSTHLEVQLRILQTTVRLGDPVSMTVIIRNKNPQQSVVLRGAPGFSESGGLSVVIVNGRNEQRTLAHRPGTLSLAAAQTGSPRVILPPGASLAVSRRERASALFAGTGTYWVQVNYQSPLPAPGNPSVSSAIEGSQAASNVIAIEVIQ